MKYEEVLDYLVRLELFGIKLGLENTNRILTYLGSPHKRYPCIHIAGTNGKGSTAAMLASIMAKAGYRAGLYTSPHLVDFRERIRINDEFIEPDYIIDFFSRVKGKFEEINPTYFEAVTALAFKYFHDSQVDIAIIETGMGGRFDSTNVVTPLAAIITNIDLEHTRYLGESIEKIAFEKAGIIKTGIPLVSAVPDNGARRIIKDICNQRNAEFVSIFDNAQWSVNKIDKYSTELDLAVGTEDYRNLPIGLAGRHQIPNAVLSVIAVKYIRSAGFKLDNAAVMAGLRDVGWRGRLERLQAKPEVVLDVAHNPAAMKCLCDHFAEFYANDYIIAVFGVLDDKDSARMLADLCWIADHIILTAPQTKRAADLSVLADRVARLTGNFQVVPVVDQAYNEAISMAKDSDIVLVAGSHYTIGETIECIAGSVGKKQVAT